MKNTLVVLLIIGIILSVSLSAALGEEPQLTAKRKSFLEAIAKKDQKTVSQFISEGAELNPPCLNANHKCNPLTIAIEQSSLEVILELLNGGADSNARNPYGRRPLHYALDANHPDRMKVVLALLERGADPNVPNDFGISPFMEASFIGDLDSVQSMLAKGVFKADVNFSAPNRTSANQPSFTTPLMQAAGRGHVPIIEVLLKQGADPSKKNSWGMTATDYATKFCTEERQRTEVIKLLEQNKTAQPTTSSDG